MSGFVLKILALIFMMIDHTGHTLSALYDTSIMRVIGRAAFPIYVFFIAIGSRKTSDIRKYALRLLLFAFISEIPFDLAIANLSNNEPIVYLESSHQNVFFTLFLGVLCIWIIQFFKSKKWNKFLAALPIIIIILLGDLFQTDYGSAGVFFICLVYLTKIRYLQILSIIGLSFYFYIYRGFIWSWSNLLATITSIANSFLYFSINTQFFLSGVIAALLLCFYNGKRGPNPKWLQWFFYAAYPLHLLILAALWILWLSK